MANNEENKSIFKKLQEGLFNIRILPKPDKLDNAGIVKDGQTLSDILNDELSDVSSGLNLSELEKFKTLSNDRELQCEALEEMLSDPEIAKALKMYADDATQADQEGRIIWVESDDPEVAAYGNKLLKDLNIAELANPTIYSMCLYGDCYWKLFENISETNPDVSVLTEPLRKGGSDIHTQVKVRGSTLRRYVERISNPTVVYELKKRDKTCGFIKLPERRNTLNTTSQSNYNTAFNANLQNNAMNRRLKIMRPNKFIHFYIPDPANRFPEQLNLTNSELESESYIFDVAKGKSAIADLYKTYQQLKLMEDSLLLNRVTRSSIIRLLSIEVGDAPKSKIPLMIKRLKDKMEQKNLIDKNVGSFKSQAAPGPMENIIFTTMKDGKGAISAQNIGGDVNVGELSDYDTFANKKYALLGIPKGMLAQDMDGCLSGDTELILLNGQRRTIKYLEEHKKDYIGKGIMSCNEDGKLVPTIITNIKKTRPNAMYVRVTLDNGEHVDATPDHLFMLRNGEFKEAQDLIPGESLMPYYDYVKNGRRYVRDNKSQVIIPQYRLVAETKFGKLDKPKYQVHHINEIKINDDFDNLDYISISDHYKKHEKMLRKRHKESNKLLKETNPEEYKRRYPGSIYCSTKGKIWITDSEQELLIEKDDLAFYEELGWRRGKCDKTKENVRKGCNKDSWKEAHKISNNDPEKNIFKNKERHKEVYKKSRETFNEKYTKEQKHEILSNAGKNGIKKCLSKRLEKSINNGTHIEEHNVRCFKCGKVHSRSISINDYNEYLKGNKFFYCSKECNFSYPSSTKISQSLKLISEVGYDNYEESRKSKKYGRPDQFMVGEKIHILKDLLDNYSPEIINHKVVSVEWLEDVSDAYDIEVANESHAFALACGIFVHNSGLSNGGSLTELSAPYARFIMSLKQIYMNTVKNLIDIFIIDDKLEDTHLGNFEVRMTPLVTIEDVRRDEVFGQRIDSINNFMSLLDTVGEDEEGTPIINPAKKKEILTYFVNNYLSRPEIAEIIDEEPEDEELEETDTGFTNTGSEDSEFGGFSGGGFDNFGDTEVPEIGGEEIPEETPSDNTETAAVDSNIDIGAESDDEGFGDF